MFVNDCLGTDGYNSNWKRSIERAQGGIRNWFFLSITSDASVKLILFFVKQMRHLIQDTDLKRQLNYSNKLAAFHSALVFSSLQNEWRSQIVLPRLTASSLSLKWLSISNHLSWGMPGMRGQEHPCLNLSLFPSVKDDDGDDDDGG